MTLTSHLSALLVVLSFIAVGMANGFVHKLPTKIHKLSPETAKQRLLQRYAKNPQMLKLFSHKASLEIPDDTPTKKNNRTVPFYRWVEEGVVVANISVGTPPQWFIVEVDWYYDRNVEFIDSNSTRWQYAISEGVHLFNSSLSSTYSPVAGGFYDDLTYSRGHRGEDIVNINGQKYKLTFGILDNTYIYFFTTNAIDGILGLSPAKQVKGSINGNMTTALTQIMNSLDNPLVSVWTNSSREEDGNGQITLGSLDNEHCESNWMFMPKTESDYYYGGYSVHLATVEGTWTNGTQQTFKANLDLAIVPNIAGIIIDVDWIDFFRNISNAVWDTQIQEWIVDCDTTKSGNVTFRIGGHGYGQNSKTYNLTVTGADYTAYYEYYDVCYLSVSSGPRSGNKYSMPVILGHNFARDHCLAYNAKDNKIGIADSKTQNTRFLDYD